MSAAANKRGGRYTPVTRTAVRSDCARKYIPLMRFAPEFDPNDGRSDDGDGGEALDEDFPLGDGTADLEATAVCPYCAQAVTLALDPGSGASQEYVEDCSVCCQPWKVRVSYSREGGAHVSLEQL